MAAQTLDLGLPDDDEIRTAVISNDGLYRYQLARIWANPNDLALWVMLNPSTADHETDDPTIRRCRGFSKAWGHGGMVVVNLFAWRATDPQDLVHAEDPIGGQNAATVRTWLNTTRVKVAVAAWGASWRKISDRSTLGVPRLNVEGFAEKAGRQLVCLGTTKDGSPRHPLYVAAATKPVPYPVIGQVA